MAKKAAKKTSKKTAKKATAKVAEKAAVKQDKSTGKSVTKKTVKKSPEKGGKDSGKKSGAKSEKDVAVKSKKAAGSSGGNGNGKSLEVNEEKINTVTDKAKKTAKKTRVKAPKKKSVAAALAPAPEIKRGLKLAPGVLLTGIKKTENHAQQAGGESTEYRKLTKKEAQQIKEKLIEMREDILEGVRKELADSKSRASSAPADIIDQAADAYDDDVSFEIAAASDEELEQIEAALERLEEGSYGQCESCSATISPTRLKILPFATRCVSCRGDYEKTKRRRDSGLRNFFGEGELDEETVEI